MNLSFLGLDVAATGSCAEKPTTNAHQKPFPAAPPAAHHLAHSKPHLAAVPAARHPARSSAIKHALILRASEWN
jgi:hypothetical protein